MNVENKPFQMSREDITLLAMAKLREVKKLSDTTMRTIKFRGKRKDDGRWIYGYLADGESINNIDEIDSPCEEVNPSTIGQFTGLTDCNGKEIYEGDIMTYGKHIKHLVEFKHGMFGYTLLDGWFVGYGGNSNFTFNPLDQSKEHEVIGNIHDNPGLLK